MRRLALVLVALATSLVPVSGAADAAVTGCVTPGVNNTRLPGVHWGFCGSTTANPPYTTQFAVIGNCRRSGRPTIAASSDWTNAGSHYAAALCPKGYTAVAGTGYYLFR